jgi:hypothetical protein
MPGRNDPCPCGSGKKFKKCCIASTPVPLMPMMAANRANANRFDDEPWPEPAPKVAVDPRRQVWQAFWAELNRADFEGRVSLYQKALADEHDPPGDEAVYEILQSVHARAVTVDDEKRLAFLIGELREKQPELYEAFGAGYLRMLLGIALRTGFGALPELGRELARFAASDLDTVTHVIELLEYHGQLALLVEISRAGWPAVKVSDDIMSWAIHQFAERAARYEILFYLDSKPDAAVDDPALLSRLAFFIKRLSKKRVAEQILHRSGRANRTWTLADFEMSPLPEEDEEDAYEDDWDEDADEEDDLDDEADKDDAHEDDADPEDDDAEEDDAEEDDAEEDDADAEEDENEEEDDEEDDAEEEEDAVQDMGRHNLAMLCFEFAQFAHEVEGFSRSRAEQAREHVYEYLVERFDGKLTHRGSLLDNFRPQGSRRPIKEAKPLHPLCPDWATLDRYLARLMGFLSARVFPAAALFELTPAWLRFLQARGLLETDFANRVQQALAPLANDMRKAAGRYKDLVPGLDKAWPQAAKK